jgi:hypothetical protein
MTLNQQIESNLNRLFDENFSNISGLTLEVLFQQITADNPDVFDLDKGDRRKLYDDSLLDQIKKAFKRKKVISAFDKAVQCSFDEQKAIAKLSSDLKRSFQEIKSEIKAIDGNKLQIIFLEHDEPMAWLGGFGAGDYKVLESPAYIDFDFEHAFFEAKGSVDYAPVWKNFIKLTECLEDAELLDDLADTDFYRSLENCYVFKTYLLLHRAFEMTGDELFGSLDIQKPLYIYGNQHDCETINIYCYDRP